MSANKIIALNYKHLAYAKKAEDGSWSTGTAAIGHRTVALAIDPDHLDAIYVGTDGHGVLKTEDYGKTWTPVGLKGQIVRSLAVSKLQAGTIYADTKPAHLYVSYDYGENWTELPAFRRMKRWYWLTPAEVPMSAYVIAMTWHFTLLMASGSTRVAVGVRPSVAMEAKHGLNPIRSTC